MDQAISPLLTPQGVDVEISGQDILVYHSVLLILYPRASLDSKGKIDLVLLQGKNPGIMEFMPLQDLPGGIEGVLPFDFQESIAAPEGAFPWRRSPVKPPPWGNSGRPG
jgi:hypothetical protein